MTKIKICGITNLEDAILASDLGADALGFVFAESPRNINPRVAKKIILSLPPFLMKIGVFVNEKIDKIEEIHHYCRLNFVQLHGEEDESYVCSLGLPAIKAFRVRNYKILDKIAKFKLSYFLLDSYQKNCLGGTGKTFNWDIAEKANKMGKLILSGGLNPLNVKQALKKVHPYAVDVSSGVESKPGTKDPLKMQTFIQEVRKWDGQTD